MNRTQRPLKMTTPNHNEAPTGWVRSWYYQKEPGRWSWSHRGGVISRADYITSNVHRMRTYPDSKDVHLVLVRQFPHYLNDIVELPIWP